MVEKKKNLQGKRVIYLGLLEQQLAVYGTIQSIESFSKEHWTVMTAQGHVFEGPSTSFEVCEETDDEFQPGDKAIYPLDKEDYCEGIMLYPFLGFEHDVRFVFEITSWNHAGVKASTGDQFSERPRMFRKKEY